MKTTNLKNVVMMLVVVTGIVSAKVANAQAPGPREGVSTGNLGYTPQVQRPAKREGTETELSDEQVRELAPWTQNSKEALEGLQRDIETQTYRQQKDTLYAGIDHILGTSKSSSSAEPESLMRYILGRGLTVVDMIDGYTNHGVGVGVIDQEVRVLKRTVKFALDYYKSDIEKQTQAKHLPMAKFALEYVPFLMEINESLLNTRASFDIAYTAIKWFKKDLAADAYKEGYGNVLDRLVQFTEVNKLPVPRTSQDAVEEIMLVRKKYHDCYIAAQKKYHPEG